MDVSPRLILSKDEFANWVKAYLALCVTRNGLAPVVCDKSEELQKNCLKKIYESTKMTTGTKCSTCTTKDVVVCPTNYCCNARFGFCKYHRTVNPRIPFTCPNNICHKFRRNIEEATNFHHMLTFDKSDATKWCFNPLEIAKCFLPLGYNNVKDVAEIDFNGIIGILMHFQRADVFMQAQCVGIAVEQYSNLEVRRKDLREYLSILNRTVEVLLKYNRSVENAATELKKIENNDELVIGKDTLVKILDCIWEWIQKMVMDKASYIKDVKQQMVRYFLSKRHRYEEYVIVDEIVDALSIMVTGACERVGISVGFETPSRPGIFLFDICPVNIIRARNYLVRKAIKKQIQDILDIVGVKIDDMDGVLEVLQANLKENDIQESNNTQEKERKDFKMTSYLKELMHDFSFILNGSCDERMHDFRFILSYRYNVCIERLMTHVFTSVFWRFAHMHDHIEIESTLTDFKEYICWLVNETGGNLKDVTYVEIDNTYRKLKDLSFLHGVVTVTADIKTERLSTNAKDIKRDSQATAGGKGEPFCSTSDLTVIGYLNILI